MPTAVIPELDPEEANIPALACCSVIGPQIGVKKFDLSFDATMTDAPAQNADDGVFVDGTSHVKPSGWEMQPTQSVRITRDRYRFQALIGTLSFDRVQGAAAVWSGTDDGRYYGTTVRLVIRFVGAESGLDYSSTFLLVPFSPGGEAIVWQQPNWRDFPAWLPNTELALGQIAVELFGFDVDFFGQGSPAMFAWQQGFQDNPAANDFRVEHARISQPFFDMPLRGEVYARQELDEIDFGGEQRLTAQQARQFVLLIPPNCSMPTEDLNVRFTMLIARGIAIPQLGGIGNQPGETILGRLDARGFAHRSRVDIQFRTVSDIEPP